MRAEEKLFLAIGNINAKLINDVLEKEFDADNSAEDAGEQRSGGCILVLLWRYWCWEP